MSKKWQGPRSQTDRQKMFDEIADNTDEVRAPYTQAFDGEKPVDDVIEGASAAEVEAQAAEAEARRLQEEGAERAKNDRERAARDRKKKLQEEKDETDEQELEETIETPRKFKLKVNGKDLELTEAELIERAQKVEAADEYLRAAAESVRNATQLPKVEEPEEAEVDLEDALNKALMGDQEAVKKLAQALKPKPSRVTPDVLQAVDERMTFRSAADWFNTEYADLLADPMLKKLVYEEDAELSRTAPNMPYKARLETVGNKIRTWKQGFSSVDTKVDKLARKASVASVPQAGGRQRVHEEDDGDESVESVIETMAKARGQAAAIRKPYVPH